MAQHIPAGAAPLDEFDCRRAVELRPKSAEARFNLARALVSAGNPAEAVEQCSKSLELRSEFRYAARLLASLLQRYALNDEIEISPRGLLAAFRFIDVDRQALCNAAIALLKFSAPLADAVALGNTAGWDAAAAYLIKGKGRKLLQDRLLRAALTHGVNTDVELEFLLTAIRKQILKRREALSARPIYEFVCVLIRQCANNGHVFYVSDEEHALLADLEFDLEEMFSGATATAGNFMLAALYIPLSELIGSSFAARDFGKISPRALRPVIKEHLDALSEETANAASMPQLTPITDETSQRVASQYRTAPYPRWLSLQAPQPGSARARLREYFPEAHLGLIEGTCDVLIAGAGTCQQAIHSAIAYGPESRVLALDLSAPSLAYGARMGPLLGAENLRYTLGDILRLDETDALFDVIECAGVLHHMAAPYDAWRTLLSRLRPGGLMQIGLYSAVSRRDLAALADDPGWPGPQADDDSLRRYRNILMRRSPKEPSAVLPLSIDFFATGDFRDLALHVQEQRCTIPDIRKFLATNGLDFHGFILPVETRDAFANMFADDGMPGTLMHWWEFEQANPRTFDGMYMFWCRKAT